MPFALIRMSALERERYVRWWVDESGLSAEQLRKMAAAIWGDAAIQGFVRHGERRNGAVPQRVLGR